MWMKDRADEESSEPNRVLVTSEAARLSCPEAGAHVFVC